MSASGNAAPSVDKNGELILGQSNLADVWCQFLEGKFKPTEAELGRDQYEALGPEPVKDPLTEQNKGSIWRSLKREGMRSWWHTIRSFL